MTIAFGETIPPMESPSPIPVKGDTTMRQIIFGLDAGVCGQTRVFSEDGGFLVCSTAHGTILVADLIDVQERLTGVGLGWRSPR
jgi:hypothetical protein